MDGNNTARLTQDHPHRFPTNFPIFAKDRAVASPNPAAGRLRRGWAARKPLAAPPAIRYVMPLRNNWCRAPVRFWRETEPNGL